MSKPLQGFEDYRAMWWCVFCAQVMALPKNESEQRLAKAKTVAMYMTHSTTVDWHERARWLRADMAEINPAAVDQLDKLCRTAWDTLQATLAQPTSNQVH